jgi:uncharacterized protein
MKSFMKTIYSVLFLLAAISCTAQDDFKTKNHYNKMDTTITMRDGVKLYTVIYTPKDESQNYPMLMERTPYSAGPYGSGSYGMPAPNMNLLKEKYIFVVQDVRGRYLSEGRNEEVTPHIANKKSNKEVDESSDTYDTVEWLLKNIKNNNGRVGLSGISYPGFYATASLPDAHPAIKAVSPQAPVTDEFLGDDANHNGAFFLMDNFGFMQFFNIPVKGPVKNYAPPMFATPRYRDAYKFFLDMGPVKNSNGSKYYNGKSYIYNEYLQHDTYDAYWKSRNIRPHLNNIKPATLVVGGWYDAEDLFGALRTYEALEKQNKGNQNFLVMGPWTHGAWASPKWESFGTHEFGSNTSQYFQDSLETAFFNFYLKDKGSFTAAEATVFDAGAQGWKRFPQWPPAATKNTPYYFNEGGQLSQQKPTAAQAFDEYVSDPAKPVPYANGIFARRHNGYMVDDQRFAASRTDVVVYSSDVLTADMVLAGEIKADLKVSLTSTDADFIVKLIEVLPDSLANMKNAPSNFQLGGMQRMVRAEIMRGKFRNSFEKPEPFVPGKVATVAFQLNDVMHTFKKGSRIMIQVQSSWFPLADRNPQKFMRIPDATEKDFQKATIRIHRSAQQASAVWLPVLQ